MEIWYIFKKEIAHEFGFAIILLDIHEHLYFLIFSSAEKKLHCTVAERLAAVSFQESSWRNVEGGSSSQGQLASQPDITGNQLLSALLWEDT